jgi:hypothetical protein
MTPPLIEIPRSMARHPNLAGAGAAPHGPKDMRSDRTFDAAIDNGQQINFNPEAMRLWTPR